MNEGKLPKVNWEEIMDHIDHAVKLVGADHVGLGSDLDGATMPIGMEDVSKIPQLTEAMLRRGYSEDDIRKILGGNTLRVMAENERISDEMRATEKGKPIDAIPGAGSMGVGNPECIFCPRPDYPSSLKNAKVDGDVELSLVVGVDGNTTEIGVVSGFDARFNEKAIEAVKHWRFKPALGPDSKPAACRIHVVVTFRVFDNGKSHSGE
jgi:TonB family protein